MKDLWFALTASKVFAGFQALMIAGAWYNISTGQHSTVTLWPLSVLFGQLIGVNIFGLLGVGCGLYAWRKDGHKPTMFLVAVGVVLAFSAVFVSGEVLYQLRGE